MTIHLNMDNVDQYTVVSSAMDMINTKMNKGVEKEKEKEKKEETNKINYNIFVPLFLFPRPSTRGQVGLQRKQTFIFIG